MGLADAHGTDESMGIAFVAKRVGFCQFCKVGFVIDQAQIEFFGCTLVTHTNHAIDYLLKIS